MGSEEKREKEEGRMKGNELGEEICEAKELPWGYAGQHLPLPGLCRDIEKKMDLSENSGEEGRAWDGF